jgi:hypothetical protein
VGAATGAWGEKSARRPSASPAFEMRPLTSIAVMNDSAVTGPTPEIAMKRRHSSLCATVLTTR